MNLHEENKNTPSGMNRTKVRLVDIKKDLSIIVIGPSEASELGSTAGRQDL